MIVLERVIWYKAGDVFHIYTSGDEHFGTLACQEHLIVDQYNRIANDPFGLYIGMGDKGEYITPTDKRWEQELISPWVERDRIAYTQARRFIEVAKPIRDGRLPYSGDSKMLGLHSGNHEDSYGKLGADNIHRTICEELNVPSLGRTAITRISWREINGNTTWSMLIRSSHPDVGAVTEAGKKKKLLDTMKNWPTCDIVVMGHMHSVETAEITYKDLNKAGHIVDRDRAGAVTGCWYETYLEGAETGYGERKEYSPSKLGCPVFKINPAKRQIRVTRAY
ncbi:MAG: hypothetical protein SVY53_05400 [Chloroflexota bacterium]|nr:hypothetical protein [Chloroflexota bacterium]